MKFYLKNYVLANYILKLYAKCINYVVYCMPVKKIMIMPVPLLGYKIQQENLSISVKDFLVDNTPKEGKKGMGDPQSA